MISLRFDQLATMIGGRLHRTADAEKSFTGVSIDSRTLRQGELFFAIRGQHHDGHDFIDQAVEKGAGGIVIEYDCKNSQLANLPIAVVVVHNSHEAMISLARNYREILPARFAAITGSNGKTTTKELAVRLVSTAEKSVYGSPGNLNNLFGAPLALFAMPSDTRVAIIELGISTPGEMTRLAGIVQPEIVLITNVGPSHLEFLHSVEQVAQAKLELVTSTPPDAPVILNADDPILMAQAAGTSHKIVTFAVDRDADFKPESIERGDNGATLVTIDGHPFTLPLIGKHQVYNLLAAYALHRTLGYTFNGIDTSSIPLDTAPWRGQIVRKNDITFLADCYNANPDSVRAGLNSFFEMPGGQRRLVILGDMLELGDSAVQYHREIGQLLARQRFDLAVFVGELSRYTMEAALESGTPTGRVKHYDTAKECTRAMRAYFAAGDYVYVKGSRGIGLEIVLDAVPPTGGND